MLTCFFTWRYISTTVNLIYVPITYVMYSIHFEYVRYIEEGTNVRSPTHEITCETHIQNLRVTPQSQALRTLK